MTDDLVIVDVRSKEEFDSGHFDGAINIPVDVLKDRYVELDTSSPILVYCGLGYRSIRASNILVEKGYEVFNLEEGYQAYLDKK